jgi:hypothetical protein
MTEKYYAAHIKTLFDAAAINVVRPKRNKKSKKAIPNTQAATATYGCGNGCVKSGNVQYHE